MASLDAKEARARAMLEVGERSLLMRKGIYAKFSGKTITRASGFLGVACSA